jgi:hypothetical protein
VPKKNLGKFSGNFLFASIGSCCGFNKGRRDDIESILYLLIYYLNQGKLPWCNLRSELGIAGWTFSDILWERLQQYYTRQLFQMVPPELELVLKNVLKLQFNERPHYEEIRETLTLLLNRSL